VPEPRIDEQEPVEIAVDDITVVVGDVSKYEARSLNAHVDPGMVIDLDELDEIEEAPQPVEPVRPAAIAFGEWRSESKLDGAHYHRKDSRRP
jgi:hypothetical protein